MTFFDLEWTALEDDRAAQLLADPALGRYAHLLGVMRRTRPHRLNEAQERVLTEKALTVVSDQGPCAQPRSAR